MGKGFAGREAPYGDRRMWKLLLARLHPDVGGDPELFLFACALKERLDGERRPGAANRDGTGPDHPFSTWRTTMGAWASRNREGLRKPETPHRGRPRGR